MKLASQRSRRLAAAVGAAAAGVAVPVVIATGPAAQSFGSDEPTTTTIPVPPNTTSYVPTVDPDPGTNGNPEGTNGDLG